MRQQTNADSAGKSAAAEHQRSSDLIAQSLQEADKWRQQYEAEAERTVALERASEEWQRKYYALENDVPVRVDKLAASRLSLMESDLDKAHACIATLRTARWQAAAKKREARLEAEEVEEGEMYARRLEAEAGVLAFELAHTEEALQHSSAAAVALGQKAEQLLMRLTETTAMAAQRVTADLIGASVRGGGGAMMGAISQKHHEKHPSPVAPSASLHVPSKAQRLPSPAAANPLGPPVAAPTRGMPPRGRSVPQLVPKHAPKEVCVTGRR